jgi:rhodanese-related sulfurtransferase
MDVITRDELKAKLDRGEPIKLVNVLEEWAFRAKHIPGSINIPINGGSFDQLSREEEVVVYCSGTPCPASWLAAKRLLSRGYQRIHYFAGGLAEWEEAGYPVAGEWVPA